MRNVLAILIADGAAFSRTEIEVLSAGSRLAQRLGGSLTAVVLGPADDAWNLESFAYGASRVLRTNGLNGYQSEVYAAAAQRAASESKADIVLFPSTTYGLEIAPQAGYRLGASVTFDCTAVEVEGAAVRITKPTYGGKANSELVAKAGPMVVALRMRSVAPVERQAGRSGETAALQFDTSSVRQRSKIVQRLSEDTGGSVRLEDARVIISGGRGMGSKENFVHLEDLARLLGGTIGASRAACDLGWVSAGLQIGQTGKKVAPELYLAVGISGASQHLAGVSGARHIVAVNTDANAPIFKAAEIGVVDDWSSFLPRLMEALKQHMTAGGGTAT